MTTEDTKRIRELLEFLVKQKVAERVKHLSETEKRIYNLTGVAGQTEIVKSLKTAPNTVSNTWKKLETEGLILKDGKGYKKVI